MRLGDTFRLHGKASDQHLKIVLSDPSQNPLQVVVVSVSSWVSGEDQSCVIDAGEHRYVKHRSLVLYSRAQVQPRIPSDADLEALKRARMILPHDPLDEPLLERVLDGAAVTGELPAVCRQILEQQQLI